MLLEQPNQNPQLHKNWFIRNLAAGLYVPEPTTHEGLSNVAEALSLIAYQPVRT